MCEFEKGLSVAVLGFGRAGRAAADFLLARGAKITVYAEQVPERGLADYRAQGVDFCFGEFPSCFKEQLLVRSPGIRPDVPAILRSLANGAMLTSETELFFEHCPARVIGVTGSDGKTTTANLIAALLRGAGHTVHLGGNNGTPLLPTVDRMKKSDFAVVELSSFQLMTLDRSPEIAVITNITPNHLNWHTEMNEYIAAKCRIFKSGTQRLILNENSDILQEIAKRVSISVTFFSANECELCLFEAGTEQRLSVPDTFLLPGQHNRENLAAAYAAVRGFVTPKVMQTALTDFRGVPHRLQYIDTVAGVNYYNSSIDTSPTRTVAALSAIGGHPLVIVGGRGKGVSFAPVADALAAHARAVFLYGEAASEIETAVAGRVPTHRFTEFSLAFDAAARMAKSGDTVLLSPACTAFDQFRDFEQRGDFFCTLVKNLKQ